MRSLATWALPRVKRHSRICLLVVAAAVVGGGAWAIAAVPDSHGVIHACYPVRSPGSKVPTANATLRVIDPSAGQSCNTAAGAAVPEASISWNQIGRQGRPGAPRPSCSRVGHVALKEGISQENAKKVAKIIRDEGPKGVKAQVQGDELRVSSKSRDDLQSVMRLLKETDLGIDMQFTNYR